MAAVATGVLLGLLGSSAVGAHAGHPVGARWSIAQEIGPYAVTLALELPATVPGPLFVDVTVDDVPAAATLELSAMPVDGDHPGAPVRLHLETGDPGPYVAQLSVDRPGRWELLAAVDGPAGRGLARIPVLVEPPAPPLTATVRTGALVLGGALLLAATAAVAAAARRPLPRWLPWGIGLGVAVCLIAGGAAGMREALSPPAALLSVGAATPSRPHVNALLRTEPAAPRAGQPVAVTLDLVDGATGRPVDDLVLHHEAPIHGVLVSDDGGFFAHVHPARVGPGRYRIDLVPERSGPHTFYLELARAASGTQLVSRPLHVAGDRTGRPAPALPPVGRHEVGGLTVEGLASVAAPTVGEAVTYTFRIGRDGRPVDLQPWLGMAGHLIVRSADAAVFAHVHALGAMDPVASAPLRLGPEVRFTYAFPQAGRYQAWFQFKQGGRVRTLPLRVDVRAGEEG